MNIALAWRSFAQPNRAPTCRRRAPSQGSRLAAAYGPRRRRGSNGDVAEFDLFVQEYGDRDLVRGVQDRAGWVPRDARVVASATQGNFSVSGAKNSSLPSGQVWQGKLRRKAFRISQRVLDRVAHVVTPSCAMIEPSTNSTIECAIDCGCTRMSISSAEALKSQRASITSSPLFIIVAESTVIFAPIRHVGCRSAWAGVAFSISSFDEFRKGPPDAVRISRLTSPRRSPRRHWCKALCSLSTGNNSARIFGRPRHQFAGDDQRLFVRQRDAPPEFQRAINRQQSPRADDRADHYLHAVAGRDFAQPFDADADPRRLHATPPQFVSQLLRALLVAGRDYARAILFDLLGQQLDVRPRAQGRHRTRLSRRRRRAVCCSRSGRSNRELQSVSYGHFRNIQ